MESSEKSNTAGTDNSWQEEAARLLLRSGFKPADTIGQVQHIAYSHREGRTFGSVWRAMRMLVDSEPEGSASKGPDVVCGKPRLCESSVVVGSKAELGRASPAEAVRLLFGTSVNGAMSEDRTETHNVRTRGGPSRTPEAAGSCSFSDAARVGISRVLPR